MLRHYVLKHLRLAWSPQQISGKLKAMSDPDANGPSLPVVSHETIYRAIYVIPRGELRKDLIGCMRKAHKTRGARWRGASRTIRASPPTRGPARSSRRPAIAAMPTRCC